MKMKFNYICLVILIGSFVFESSLTYAGSGELPGFSKGQNYVLVREKMIEAGWKPFHSSNADECLKGDKRCEGRPEMEACAGTGMGNCKFLWVKDSKKVAICTVGEKAEFDAMCNF